MATSFTHLGQMAHNLRSVSFTEEKDQICEYDPHILPHFQDMRERLRRTINERRLLRNPRAEMHHVLDMLKAARDQPILIVHGDLGRQLHLLTYYLDLVFTTESVGVLCPHIPPPQDYPYLVSGRESLDFLFLVEPRFGSTISKRKNVKHVVVLTSHTNLFPKTLPILSLFLVPPRARLETYLPYSAVWEPPVWVEDGVQPEGVVVALDVRKARTAHEAYLRWCTGRQLMGGRRYVLNIKPVHASQIAMFTKENLPFNRH